MKPSDSLTPAKPSQAFDLIVIGSGPGGQKGAIAAAKIGKKVALIEDCEAVGGGCVFVGTLPSKSLRESVYRWSLGSRGTLGQEGEHARKVTREGELPDMARLLKRKDRVVSSEAKVVFDQLKRNGIEVFHGRGRIAGPNEVEVETQKGKLTLKGKFILIATGATPMAPQHLEVDRKLVHDSNSILNLKRLPKKMVVLGAGIIGCEYASIFSMAGTQVHLVDKRHEILASVDREIVEHLGERFVHEGMELILKAEAVKIEEAAKGAGVRVHLSNGDKVSADVVLIALGRRGNSSDLGLEKVGLKADERGLIPVDKYYRTSVPTIYAVGDVIGAPALASTSMEQGRIATHNAFQIEPAEISQFFPYGIYTIPEISMVGQTEEDCKSAKLDFVVGRARYRELARGQIVGDHWGLLKIIVDKKSQKLLGIHIVGDNAAELVHIGQSVMAFGGTVDYFIRTVFNYPTLAEAYKTAAFDAVNQLKGRARRGSAA